MSRCPDIADVLQGRRTLELPNKNILALEESYTIPADTPTPCVVSHVFLDYDGSGGIETTYERHLYTENGNRESLDAMFTTQTAMLAENEQLVVVSCNELSEVVATRNLTMLPTTNFDFILRNTSANNIIRVIECHDAFCMLVLSTPGCINSEYIQGVIPRTDSNIKHMIRLQMSMIGAVSKMMTFQGMVPISNRTPTKAVIMGMNATGSYVAMECTCMNEANAACTPEQADSYKDVFMLALRFMVPGQGSFLLDKMEKNPEADNRYDLIILWYSFHYGLDPSLQQYITGNRGCSVGAHSSGSTDTFRDDTGRYKIPCIVCGINKYYSESITTAPVIRKTQTMYVSSKSDSDIDEYAGIRIFARKYFVAPETHPSPAFREQFRQQSEVDIGTTLVLMLGTPYENSPAHGSTILRVVCDGVDIAFTRNESTPSISFEVLAMYSGKLIEVHVADAACCGSNGPSTETFQTDWMVLPALIFPRAPTVAQNCLLCPSGKFHGAYGATDISQCKDTVAPTLRRRSQLGHGPLQVPVSHQRRSNSGFVVNDSQAFKTYLEIQGVFMDVLEIRQVTHSESDLQSVFALEVLLDTVNVTFVLENSIVLSGQISTIYDAQRDDMKTTNTSARLIVVGENTMTIFSMQGVYGPDLPPSSVNTLPATTPIPQTKTTTAVKTFQTTISFALNADMNQLTDSVTNAIRINLAVKLNVDIMHISALSFEQIRVSTRRLLQVRASLTVTSLSLAASQNIQTTLSHSVFNSILATSSNNVLVATNFEVVTITVGGSTQHSKMSITTILLITGGACIGCVIAIIIIVAVMGQKSATTHRQYHAVDMNHMYPPNPSMSAMPYPHAVTYA
jgi:hypothetical protein